MKSPKQIVYRYNGDAATEEVELDMDGDQEVPQKDSIVLRKGSRWKVGAVMIEEAVPIHRVFLTNQF